MSDLWFKRRRYGWGWTPVTWQGWAVLACYVALVVAGSLAFGDGGPGEVALFLLLVAILTVTLVQISLARGPKPRWRWGRSASDDPAEDL